MEDPLLRRSLPHFRSTIRVPDEDLFPMVLVLALPEGRQCG